MPRGFGSTYGAGSSDIVQTSFTSAGSNKRTYSIWYYRNGAGASSFGSLWRKSSGGTNQQEYCYWDGPATTPMIAFARCNSSGTITSKHLIPVWNTSANTGIWNHMLLTHDQTSGLQSPLAYFNGAFASGVYPTTSDAPTAADNTSPYYLGNRPNLDRNWDGLIAHFTVWDNIILSTAEAASLSSGADPRTISPGNIVCYIPLDGISSPEPDAKNNPASVSGTKFGSIYLPRVPPVFPRPGAWSSRTRLKRPYPFSSIAPASSNRPRISVIT